MDATCESCGRPDDDLETVRRVYLTPTGATAPGDDDAEPTLDDHDERWCASCRSTYPHQPVD